MNADEIQLKFDKLENFLIKEFKSLKEENAILRSLLLPKDNKFYSIERYDDYQMILRYPYNKDFYIILKELGNCKWMVSLKGWVFDKRKEQEINDLIKEKYPEWVLKNNNFI